MKLLTIGISIRLYTPNSGGLQHHAASLIRHLRERGHNVIIVTRAVTRAPSYQDFFYFSESASDFSQIDPNLKILRHPRFLNPVMWLVMKCAGRAKLQALAIKIYKFIYAGKMEKYFRGVDIIHHVGSGTEMIGFAAASAARNLGVPFVVQPTIHPGQWGDSKIDFELYRIADELLAHTNYEKKFFERNGLSNAISVVGNGIDGRQDGNGERFRARFGVTGPMVLFVGRKETDKGYPIVVEAFSLLKQKLENVSLVCIGPGKPAVTNFKEIIELGFLDEATKQDALAACDLLCVPSEAESFGLIYMEAACYRKAILARRLPVLDELLGVENAAVLVGKNGAMDNRVEVSATELAVEMERMLSNPAEQKHLGDNAYRVSRKFLWPIIADHFEKAYQAVPAAA